MIVKKLLAAAVCSIACVAMSSTSAFAGEITGNGESTQGPAHANSICVFSGLEDGDDNDDNIPEGPYGPGVAPQNWGHAQQDARAAGATMDDLKAAGVNPGQSCNGHTGFLAGGGEE